MKLNKKQFFSKLNEGSVKNFTINGIKFFAEGKKVKEDTSECRVDIEISYFPIEIFDGSREDDDYIVDNYEKLKDQFEKEFLKWLTKVGHPLSIKSRWSNGDFEISLSVMSRSKYKKLLKDFERDFQCTEFDRQEGFYYQLDTRILNMPIYIVNMINFNDKNRKEYN